MLTPETAREIAAIADDRTSGATALVLRGIEILRRESGNAAGLRAAAAALCAGQPAMAGFRTAAALSFRDDGPERLGRLAERVERAPAAVARFAVPVIRLRRGQGSVLRVITCSRSAMVEQTLAALARTERVEVACAESYPGGEGVRLAGSLASQGIHAVLFRDAAICTAVSGADAVVLGADALTGTAFMNKVGSAGLAAFARTCGVPVIVLAGREKILPHDVFASLDVRDEEVSGAIEPSTVTLRNPWFERVPAELAGQVITDAGMVAPEEVLRLSYWHAE